MKNPFNGKKFRLIKSQLPRGLSRFSFSSLQIILKITEMNVYLGSSGSPGETHIKTGTEGSGSTILILDVEHGSVNVGVSLVDRVQLELLEGSSGQEKASAVSSGVVGHTNLHSIPMVKIRKYLAFLVKF